MPYSHPTRREKSCTRFPISCGCPSAAAIPAAWLIDAANAFPRIYDAIKNAEHYILIEFFIIKNDSVGQNLKDLLIERARAGIRIYMLYDEIGSHKLPRLHFRPAESRSEH